MKITISDIPGDFPNGYSEQLYLNVRSVREGRDYIIAETERTHKTKNDQTFRNRKIQSIFYDKYTIELIATESIDIDRINMANTITIVQDSGEIHSAEIIDFSEGVKMQSSEFRLYNLIYRNLSNKQTVDYLSSDNVVSIRKSYFEYDDDSDETIQISTTLNPDFDISEYEVTENKSNGLTIRTSESVFDVIELTGYVTESQKNSILKNTNYTNLANISIYDIEGVSWNQYQAIEVPEVIIEDTDLEGLYPVIIRLRYNQVISYPFEIVESIEADPTSLLFPLAGGTSDVTVTYEGASDWSIFDADPWISTIKTEGNLEITVGVTGVPRSGSVEIGSNIDQSVTATINVNQSDA